MEELISDITKQRGTQLPRRHRQNLSSLLKKIEWGFKENTDNSIFICGKPQWNVKFPWDPLTSKEDSGMKGQHIWSISLLLSSKRVNDLCRHTLAHIHILAQTRTHNIKGAHQHIKAVVPAVQHAICEPGGIQQGNAQSSSATTRLHIYIYNALTAPADSRQLKIEITLRCQVYKRAHTNMGVLGILLHN